MRVSDDRYSRDLRRFNLAMRLIRHEARTHTISAWTGFPAARVRKLYRAYPERWDRAHAVRHRGPSPRNVTFFLRGGMRSEAAAVGVLCSLLGAVSVQKAAQPPRSVPSVARGERLCLAFELYHAIIPDPKLTFERVVLLVNALSVSEDLAMGRCASCDVSILVDPLGRERHICEQCREEAAASAGGRGIVLEEPDASAGESPAERQRSLF